MIIFYLKVLRFLNYIYYVKDLVYEQFDLVILLSLDHVICRLAYYNEVSMDMYIL